MDFDDYLLSDADDYDDSDKSSDDNDNSFQNESFNEYSLPYLNSLFGNHGDHQMEEGSDAEVNTIIGKTPSVERSSKQMEITFASLQNLRREDSCDVTIVCKERKFPVHRLVLRAGSSYFEAMFTCGLQETTASVINMSTIDDNSMAIILDFLYIQKVDVTDLEVNELLDLISSSHSIEVFPLFEICCEVLARNINVNNWEVVLKVGTKYENSALIDEVVQYLVVSFDWEAANENFWNLDSSCFEKLISSPTTARFHAADAILKIIMQWISVDSVNREKHLNSLISHVDFNSITREALDDLLSNNTLVRNNFSICRLLLEKVTGVFSDPLAYKSVLSSPKILLIRGNAIDSFDIKTRKWASKTIPICMTQMRFAVTESTVYFLCSTKTHEYHHADEYLNVVAYYPHNNCINSISTTHPHRSQMGVAAIGKSLYIVGGSDRNGRSIEPMERFDVETVKWTTLDAPIVHRHMPQVLALDDSIILIGGYQSKFRGLDDTTPTVIRIVEKYCIETNQWTVLTTIPGKNLKSISVVPFFKKIFVRSAMMFCEYDVKKDNWQVVTADLKLGVIGSEKWDLCSSPKPLPFLILQENCSSNKFYKLDPHSKQCIYLTEKPSTNQVRRYADESEVIVFA